jgi:hypothetical protein
MTQTRIIHDVITNEITEVELTNAEIAKNEKERKAFEAEQLVKKAEAEAKAAAKAALLAQLGITEEQAKLLLS